MPGHWLLGTDGFPIQADEALAVYMLRLLPEYKDASLTRSRDPAVLEECDIIVDARPPLPISPVTQH